MKKISRVRLCVSALFASLFIASAQADFYVAPTAQGTGLGDIPANAADYLDTTTFWPAVQSAIAGGPVTVRFATGTYTRGLLQLAYMGHPLNTLTLKATSDNFVTLKADGLTNILQLNGCQNVVIRGFNFEGTATNNAIFMWSRGKMPARNILITKCIFQHLDNMGFGAISPSTVFDLTIDNCTFYYNGLDPHFHCVYAENGCENLTVQNCILTNSKGEYVRFRNDCDFGKVTGCTFLSTADTYNAPFIAVVNYNKDDTVPWAYEFFGGNYQFTGNSFEYRTTTVPNDGYGAEGHYRYGHYFYNSDHETPPGDALQYYISAADATTLNGTNATSKNNILKPRMGLDNARIKIYGETYVSNLALTTAYRCYGDGAVAPYDYQSSVNLNIWPGTSGGLLTPDQITNGNFEALGSRVRRWQTFTGTAPTSGQPVGFSPLTPASLKAIKLDRATNTEFGHWLCGAFTATPRTIHWLMAVGNHSGTGVKAKVQVYHNEITGARLEIAINDLGQIGHMNGATFVPDASLGTIAFSNDANGDGDYTDAGDTLNWYQFEVIIDYSTGTPHFDIKRGTANLQSNYAYSATTLTSWVGTAPVVGSKIGLLNFGNIGADLLIDEVWASN